MQRQYHRGRLSEVEEMDALLAVQVDPGSPSGEGADLSEFGESAVGSLIEDDVEFDQESAGAYERGGWLIVMSRPGTDASPGGARGLTAADQAGRVIRRSGNRIGIGTDRLNIQLRPDVSEARVQRELADNGLEVVDRLTLGPNLYAVSTTAAEDALTASVAVHDSPGPRAPPGRGRRCPRADRWPPTGRSGCRRPAGCRRGTSAPPVPPADRSPAPAVGLACLDDGARRSVGRTRTTRWTP